MQGRYLSCPSHADPDAVDAVRTPHRRKPPVIFAFVIGFMVGSFAGCWAVYACHDWIWRDRNR